MGNQRVVDLAMLERFLSSYTVRAAPPTARELHRYVMDWMAGRPVAEAKAPGEFTFEQWSRLDAQEQVRATLQAHNSGVPWMQDLAERVAQVVMHYNQEVERRGGRIGDVFDTVHRAFVVTVRYVGPCDDPFAEAERLMRETINAYSDDLAWRHYVPGKDLLWLANGQALFGYPWGSVGSSGPRDTGATWPRKLQAVSAKAKAVSHFDRVVGALS